MQKSNKAAVGAARGHHGLSETVECDAPLGRPHEDRAAVALESRADETLRAPAAKPLVGAPQPAIQSPPVTMAKQDAPAKAAEAAEKSKTIKGAALKEKDQKIHKMLRAQLGEDVHTNWFGSMEIDSFDGKTVRVTVPVKFLKNWIQSHFADELLACCAAEFKGTQRVDIGLRQPGDNLPAGAKMRQDERGRAANSANVSQPDAAGSGGRTGTIIGSTRVGGFEGSPLDSRYTFDSFVIGQTNRMAHAGATQVAETIFSEDHSFNPLYLHSAVGLGKTHLLHAIAWDIKRRYPHANVLYLTAERFRYKFIEGLRSHDSLAFKEMFRSIDILLIDDLEFMHGPQTEQEFDHIINWLLDGGRQLVVASARAPNQLEKLNERMRSRLQRGLVTEINPLDYDLRLKVLERRIKEKRATDPSFEISRDVIEALANRLTENGRELEGAITRLYAHWQLMHTQISVEVAETIVRDLVHGVEPRRIKIEDILRVVTRHFGVSKSDILSQRRHRSVVWPRQIGMYLAKQMTSRSLPEIGRRFGNRDHTTVLHAIRKIDKILPDDPRLGDEIEELKKMLGNAY